MTGFACRVNLTKVGVRALGYPGFGLHSYDLALPQTMPGNGAEHGVNLLE